MAVFVVGIVGIVIFLFVILGVGFWASKLAKDDSEEEMMLAGRDLGFWIGFLTLVATWVGGGYINGTAEMMYNRGLLAAQVPIGYSISLVVGAVLVAKPMRDAGYTTLLDPFQKKYGKLGSLLIVPSIFGDFFWVAAVLNAFGSSLEVIIELSPVVSVAVSACFVAAYTSMGGMYSVTYTDVLQIFFTLFGLLLCIPFALQNPAMDPEKLATLNWVDTIHEEEMWEWLDVMLLLMLGGIPYQAYMQRILSIRDTPTAQALSALSGLGCLVMALLPATLGTISRAVDWTQVPDFGRNITLDDANHILPLSIRYLTPNWVSFFGLGAISAATMSSADSCILGFSSLFTRNLYRTLLRPKASSIELLWVMRSTVLLVAILTAIIALTVRSIYYLSVLCSDLIYVLLFPHLILVLYFNRHLNSYGFMASLVIGTLMRVLGGEPGLGLPRVIQYPGFNPDTLKLNFPHRTIAMLSTLVSHVVFSALASLAFRKGVIPKKYDILYSFQGPEETRGTGEVGKREEGMRPCDLQLKQVGLERTYL